MEQSYLNEKREANSTPGKGGLEMGMEESLKIVPHGDVAVVEWDLVDEKVNKLSSPVMQRLQDVVAELKASSYKAVVMTSKKKNIFIAGADIDEIKKLDSKDAFREVLVKAHEIFNSLEDLKIPTIAAINGACLGGGCELVLACDYRIASTDKATRIGLPEVRLGIIPGFGGCVRLPRTVGLQSALDIILAGKSVDAKKAKRIGLVDEAVPAELLLKRAMEFADEVVAGKRKKRQKKFSAKGMVPSLLESFAGRPVVFSQAKKMLLKQTKGFYPAPLQALDVIRKTYGAGRDKALAIEMDGFCEVAVTDVSKHLIDVFYMMEDVKKQTGVENTEVKAKPVNELGVLGAGVMGGGIAFVAANKGVDVRMKDINNQALAIGFKAARDLWGKMLKRRRLTKYELTQKMDHVSGGLDYAGFKTMDVVIEAIVEDLEIKKKVIAEAAGNCRPDCIMATNTSSLSVTEMATAHPRPENFVGMHFFNPVNKMPLVEVIRGEKTSDEATATIFALAKRMGKTPVVVKDGPGFLVNRLLIPWLSEAIFILQDGMDIEVVDRYYTHKFGMPMGPFRLLDEVGWDVGIKVLKIFRQAFGERMEMADLAGKLEASDRLGRKNGKGFYLYDERGREAGVDNSVYSDLGLKSPTNPLTEKECIERGILQMINEASLALLNDHIVEAAEEVDLAMIMGTGFPPFRGGLLKYADGLGSKYIVAELEEYASRFGQRFKPAQPLVNLANGDRGFY